MWKLTFFVNCFGYAPNPETGKRGYENVHYFETKAQALEWLDYQNKRLPSYPVDLVSLEKVTLTEFAEDIILPYPY